MFLNCVLDGSCEELATHVAFPGAEPSRKLIPIIAEHSPHLKKLTLNFKFMKTETKVERFKSVIHSLTSLEQLTDLRLENVDEKLRPILLSLIGQACPFLTRLVVTSFSSSRSSIKKEEILALFIGEVALDMVSKQSAQEIASEPEWLQDAQFSRLELPRTSLTPICSTLKELHLCSPGKISASAGAFILRHLPFLQELNIPGTNTSMAVKTFYKQFHFQEKFEKEFEEAVQRRSKSPPQAVPRRSLNSVFSGNLFK